MTRVKLRYVDSYIDATGKRRYYVRKSRTAHRITLPGLPGSMEFMAAYQAALDDVVPMARKLRGNPGTFDRLVQDYFESTDYLRLARSTQNAYRPVIERWVRDDSIGHSRVDQLTRAHVSNMLANRKDTPGAANDLLKKVRILINFAIANGWLQNDPTRGIKKFAHGEFHTWTDQEIAQLRGGTKERVAFGLLLYTGQRRSDVVLMSWRDIEGTAIHVAQQKTKAKLLIPLHRKLKELLAVWPRDHLVILSTGHGKPFTAAGFGNWMADKIAAAGLPDLCVTHGLRKAAARLLAEAGCTTHQIMAVTGHKSLSEVERYTKGAQQKRLAEEAFKQLGDEAGT